MTTRSDYIQMSDVSQEIWGQWNRNTSLNEDPVRILAQANRTSGTAITMQWLMGKSWWIAPSAGLDGLWEEEVFYGDMGAGSTAFTRRCNLYKYNGSGNFSVSWSVSGYGFSISASDVNGADVRFTIGRYGAELNGTLTATITDNFNGHVFSVSSNLHVKYYDGNVA